MQRANSLGLAGILLIIIGVVLLSVPRFVVGHEPMLRFHGPLVPWYRVGPVWDWWFVLVVAGRFAVFLGVLVLIAWAIQRLTRPSLSQPSSQAIAILQERYARGELTREQYEQMLRDLRG